MQTICMKGDVSMLLRRFLTGFLVLVLAMTVAGCEPEPDPDGGKKIIAVSILPQKAFATAICGDEMQVITVIPPGNSPANYEPDAREMQYLSKADLYFSIGVAAERRLSCRGSVPYRGGPGRRVARELPDRHFASYSRDPHIWLSSHGPGHGRGDARAITSWIRAAPMSMPPTPRLFLMSWTFSNRTCARCLAGQPPDRRLPSFLRLSCRRAGLEMWALEENGKEATPQHLKRHRPGPQAEIRVIFCQAEIDSRQSAAFAEEIGANIQILDPLSEDYLANMRAIAKAFADAS
jgi:zinc transport system substrate-binding protein